ncbi:MAG TPA: uroporphyrinogen decarboxylase, partial [Thermoanaerobaculia bacterium]|nr:uroporphyrinogen decarboxylase [Thermoanaerobaculia bacterium]
VWMMRQAGRFLPHYREIRRGVDFLTLCKTPELAAEVTLQPVDALGVDAAILFADILLPLEAMGAELAFAKGDGPQFSHPVRRREDIASLERIEVEEKLGYVFETVRLLRKALVDKVPLIGFGGTPWTLAAYLVEGGGSRHFEHLLSWSVADPAGLSELLSRIAEVSADYLAAQVEAGAQAIQVFDTWGGLLDAERWRRLALPALLQALEPLQGRVPLIYYVNGGSHLLSELASLPVAVLSVDWRVPLNVVRRQVGPDKVLQGNLDPTTLLAPIETIRREVERLLAEGAGGGHIVNLGHGILPVTPVENASAFVRAAQAPLPADAGRSS